MRRKRAGAVARTIPMKKLTRAVLAADAISAEERARLETLRPRTRGDCADGPRPCPWVGCKYHLYLDVNPETGSIKIYFPDVEPWQLAESCALDVAGDGAHSLEDVGGLMNVTKERLRQIEVKGLLQLKPKLPDG